MYHWYLGSEIILLHLTRDVVIRKIDEHQNHLYMLCEALCDAHPVIRNTGWASKCVLYALCGTFRCSSIFLTYNVTHHIILKEETAHQVVAYINPKMSVHVNEWDTRNRVGWKCYPKCCKSMANSEMHFGVSVSTWNFLEKFITSNVQVTSKYYTCPWCWLHNTRGSASMTPAYKYIIWEII